ncbi:hypothetical protein GNY06_01135 [Elizabethkingia argentiflava]|uniref:Secreted protein n=1 Tax=Elizabethkingia argenteiflava TaxID=2681556 RepID=A0A845PPJ7_9FLAO|nr:hypothetical protein [Elizabethkingia argenteiflava]NAW50052.1 hypothetical protein [Elizabethkingia argenteiflava]
MRKTLLILLAFFYSAVSSGAVIKMHSCLHKTVFCNMKHQSSSSSSHTCKKEIKASDCCKTKIELVKTDVAKSTNLLYLSSLYFLLPVENDFQVKNQFYLSSLGKDHLTNAPPLLRQLPIFILHCNFRL